jgi:hypothetical protein
MGISGLDDAAARGTSMTLTPKARGTKPSHPGSCSVDLHHASHCTKSMGTGEEGRVPNEKTFLSDWLPMHHHANKVGTPPVSTLTEC